MSPWISFGNPSAKPSRAATETQNTCTGSKLQKSSNEAMEVALFFVAPF